MSPTALFFPGSVLPLTRGYPLRTASTQAHEMDRNLMFYYEHLQLYDPNQVPRSSIEAERRASRRRAREARERDDAPEDAPVSPQQPQINDTTVREDEEPEREPLRERSVSPTESLEAPELSDSPESPEISSVMPVTPSSVHVHDPIQQHMTVEDPPPDYHPHPTACNPPAYQTMPESLLPDPTFCHPELADNLRRFLVFCLAIDYDLVEQCPEMLRQVDWLPFLRLARHWSWRDSRRRYQQGYDPVRPAFLGNPSRADSAADDERALKVEQCIFACIVRPAQALNLPPDVAITMLRDFPSSITSNGDYVPYFHRYRCPNTKTLATKLILDREILFDTVTRRDHRAFRSALHDANERVWGKNFVRLRSPDDYELTQFGLMREKLEGSTRAPSPSDLNMDVGCDIGMKGRKRFSRWMRKLSSA